MMIDGRRNGFFVFVLLCLFVGREFLKFLSTTLASKRACASEQEKIL
jgi:hypothetical protein